MRWIGIIILCFGLQASHAQKRKVSYRFETGGGIPQQLPFWLHTNTFGTITPDSYLWGSAGVCLPFRSTEEKAFDYSFGIEGSGSLGHQQNRLFLSQFFGQMRWKKLVLELGIHHRPTFYEGLSASNGDILYSNNSRSMPGISFASKEYIPLPWIGKWLSFRFKYAEYLMTDKRYTKDTHVHNKLLAFRLTPLPGFSLEGGIEDYAQWGGRNAQGKIKYDFQDYIDMVRIDSGDEDTSLSDQINKLGNHIGRHFAQISYIHSQFKATLYYNHLFEDGSGMKYQNWPDGLYGIYFTRTENSRYFKSLVYEFYYTKNQSGPLHDRPATPDEQSRQDSTQYHYGRIILGGNDNYLNHGEYRSGWTLFGQSIGAPFFTPHPPEDGLTKGISNNRFYAHHIGICGELPLWDIRYRLLGSYSRNYGTYSQPFYNAKGETIAKQQLSLGLQLILPEQKLPFHTVLNIGYDKGSLLKNTWGITLSLFNTGIF